MKEKRDDVTDASAAKRMFTNDTIRFFCCTEKDFFSFLFSLNYSILQSKNVSTKSSARITRKRLGKWEEAGVCSMAAALCFLNDVMWCSVIHINAPLLFPFLFGLAEKKAPSLASFYHYEKIICDNKRLCEVILQLALHKALEFSVFSSTSWN